jgi:peptide/nickel transport system substrate-binding protein
MAESSTPTARRRALLAAAGGAAAFTGGCLGRVRRFVDSDAPRRVRVRVATLPRDADPYGHRLARQVGEWLRVAGIGATVVPMAEEELFRGAFRRAEFDLFVARLPSRFRRPDALYPLLHSQFADGPGWQNPFGYENDRADGRLDAQRRASGERRLRVVRELQSVVARTQPFTLLAVPDDVRAARRTAYTGWRGVDLRSPLGYLSLARTEGAAESRAGGPRRDDTLRLAVTDERRTTNLNPLSVARRSDDVLTGLLYDPLGYATGEGVEPWRADSWTLSDDDAPVGRVRLREGTTWHDGEPFTADDVAFTFALLSDTRLGEGTGTDGAETEETRTDETDETEEGDGDVPVPSSRYRGLTTLVDEVVAADETTATFRFVECAPSVAAHAFTVPILPEHVWRERTDPVSREGDADPTTEALTTDNVPPVGSGPLRFDGNASGEGLVLERFDDHFLVEEAAPQTLARRVGGVPFERFSVRVAGTGVTAVERVAGGEADATGTPVGADAVPRIGRSDALELLVDRSPSPYVVGYNARRPHLSNPRFRRTLARLFDSEHLVSKVFDGYGRPAVGPLWGTRWYPEALEWTNGDPVAPFLGSDGELDVDRVREAFRALGYRYDGGALVVGQ